MTIRESVRHAAYSVLAVMVLLCWLPFSPAAPSDFIDSRDPGIFLPQAKLAETQGKWEDALDLYTFVLSLDKSNAEARKGFQLALRHVHRRFRHSDPSFRHQLHAVRFSEAVEFYKEMVRKVQEYYLDPERVQTARLFQEGIEELQLALQDGEFRKLYLPQARPEIVEEFCDQLKSVWGPLRIGSLTESADKAVVIAREAARRLGINPRVVMVEMACGACNALDEYSFFVTSGSLGTEVGPSLGRVKMHDNGIGYLEILNFQENTLAELEAALAQLSMAGMKSLVLDLRNNPGGSLEAAVQVAERFLNAPLAIATTSGKVNKVFHSYNMEALEVPIFVLIDANTASAAELLAGALKVQHKQAELVGVTTYGKNQIQKLVPVGLAPVGALRVSWAQFYLPRTHDLAKQGGITPTIPVSDPDRQLDVALERARMTSMR